MGLFKSIGRFFGGRKARTEQVPRYTPEQQSALDQLLSMGMSETDSKALEERTRKQFGETTVPGIAERFTGMGGGQRSSAFAGALGRAGGDLESQLAALRHQAGMQKLQQGLQQRFDTAYMPGTPGMLEGLAGPAMSMLAGRALLGKGKARGLFGGGEEGGPQYYPGQPQGYTGQAQNPSLIRLLSGLIL
jgi:hypothetical protein